MTAVAKGHRRKTSESAEQAIERLSTLIHRFERRYECSSEAMLTATKTGQAKETAEIAKWLTSYQALRNLQAHGRTTGTRTKTT